MSNPIATLFAWTGALKKRGELDGTPELSAFAQKVENAMFRTVADGFLTKDLYLMSTFENKEIVTTEQFLNKIMEAI